MDAVMDHDGRFHVVTVGWGYSLLEGLCNPIAARSEQRFSHIVHPSHTAEDWPECPPAAGVYFFRERIHQPMPPADRLLLASLEQEGVPTVHNMIIGDRVVSRLPYEDALRYATFLAHRLRQLFDAIRPDAILAGFDALHAGISLGVAKHLNIPWFALHFTSIPGGLTCFCDGMTPAATVQLRARPAAELRLLAESSLQQFESGNIQAAAYIAPMPPPLVGKIAAIPSRLRGLRRTLHRARQREFLRFTEGRNRHSVRAAMQYFSRAASARRALGRSAALTVPPVTPYVFFGLHMQPESSIDVWAPFFSDQTWVIELLARSIPPTHKLLVKIHKSDISNYSGEQLERMCALPGVELVAPFADTRAFIRAASLTIAIQGTIGLEAALLGRPVIMLGDSPFVIFPSVSRVGEITDLPALIRRKLVELSPPRSEIVSAYASYLMPFMRASSNEWTERRSADEIQDYVTLFVAFAQYVSTKSVTLRQASR
jgi:hypothetical protein